MKKPKHKPYVGAAPQTGDGALPPFHNYSADYFRMLGGHLHYWPEMFFFLRTGQPPSIIHYAAVDGSKVITSICNHFGIGVSHALRIKSVDLNKPDQDGESMLLQVSDHIVLFNNDYGSLQVFYTDNAPAEDLAAIESTVRELKQQSTRNKLHLLNFDQNMGGFHLTSFNLPHIAVDVDRHYNDDFPTIHKLVMQKISETGSKGILLLHGIPGTGKTSYIRFLIQQLDKKLIYIPSSIASRLGDPDFIPFLTRQTGSVLIIEDAEDVLQERRGGDNGTLANLLNLGDGLLSDCLNIQLICTFNAPLTRIDNALLRKGRILASYEFKPLSLEKTNRLLLSMELEPSASEGLTLAEIFHRKEQSFRKEMSRPVGFTNELR